MPLVFLHGVATRSSSSYSKEIRSRDAMFRAAFLNQIDPGGTIQNPAWGDLVPGEPGVNNRIIALPGSGREPLKAEEEPAREEFPPLDILPLARRSLADAVDAVFAMRFAHAHSRALAALSERALAAARYARADPFPGWLRRVRSDEEFIARLDVESAAQSSSAQGMPISPACEAVGTLEAAGFLDWPSDQLLAALRPAFTSAMTLFIGDVFAYLASRGTAGRPGPITRLVIEALDAAGAEAESNSRPVILICHSMGGNIAYDVLTAFMPESKIDVLITVGSQASLFRQLDLYAAGLPATGRAPKPAGVRHWVNIYDHQDTLAFLFAPEFEGVNDFEYRTDAGLIGAHTHYFTRASFYERLGARILERLKG